MAGRASVLIAQPIRKGTPQVLVVKAGDLAERLTYGNCERVTWENEQPPMDGKYKPNAAARNEFIEQFLHDDHDYVLWLDIDLVDTPVDLIEQLLSVSENRDGAIVAPMAWDERGVFYDIGGFIKDGQWADQYTGVAGEEIVVEMDSVGTCYLVPAWLYRKGLRYTPAGDDVEHVSFCAAARALGVAVLAVRDVRVTHAYLPFYGEAVH